MSFNILLLEKDKAVLEIPQLQVKSILKILNGVKYKSKLRQYSIKLE